MSESTESNFEFDIDLEKRHIERIFGINSNTFYTLQKEGVIVHSGRVEGRLKYYWLAQSTFNRFQTTGRQGQSTAASKERKEVQNAVDLAREETLRYDLSVKRGETAPTSIMREIVDRTLTMARNKISGIKPTLRSKYEELIDPKILDEIDSVLNSSCEDISNLELDQVFDLKDLILDDDS